ncbi:transglycosylase family protein [Candidatus Saccharibacteria bacterium]|nr:transglycosylase family protein [Candidatus Saccharibacteria bacterium]
MLYASLASSIPVVNTNAEFWRGRIAGCESGSGPNSTPNYQAVNGSGHYGAYQYDKSTWKGAVGPELYATYPDPRTAPPAVQDQAFYNTFARRGSQPWNASYRCWRTPELAQQNSPANIIQLLPRLGSSGSVAPTPTPLPKNAYNVTVQGRVYINNKLTPGVKLVTCVDGVTTQTDAGGVFRFELPAGKEYCVRTIDGLPSSARLVKTNNNPERTNEISYEHQLAAKNYYRNFWQFFTQYYTWDRPVDDNYDFYFVSQ